MDPQIIFPSLIFSGVTLTGEKVEKSVRRISDLGGVFEDAGAFALISRNRLVYEVNSLLPEKEGVPGGLYFGVTHIHPGMVGDEYFMTRGHFHAQADRAEYYWGLAGEGMLILMNEKREVWAERMFPGSLHYIPGGVAHRVANTGGQMLSFGACWPSDAGHDYAGIARDGFAARLKEIDGIPTLSPARYV